MPRPKKPVPPTTPKRVDGFDVWQEDDGSYLAQYPPCPNVTGTGSTESEAVKQASFQLRFLHIFLPLPSED